VIGVGREKRVRGKNGRDQGKGNDDKRDKGAGGAKEG